MGSCRIQMKEITLAVDFGLLVVTFSSRLLGIFIGASSFLLLDMVTSELIGAVGFGLIPIG